MKVIWTISAAMRRSGSPGWPPGHPQEWAPAAVTQIPGPDVRVPSSHLINGILSCPQPLPPCAPVRLAAIERHDLQSAPNTHLTARLLSGVASAIPSPRMPLAGPALVPSRNTLISLPSLPLPGHRSCDLVPSLDLSILVPFLFSKGGKSILIMKHFKGCLGLLSAGPFAGLPSIIISS